MTGMGELLILLVLIIAVAFREDEYDAARVR